MPNTETYLGDGVYARFDGYSITLRAPRAGGDHWIALEPYEFNALLEFVSQFWGIKGHAGPDKKDH